MTDIMSKEKRSALMSRIKGKNTGPERAIAKELRALGLYPSRHVKGMPGRPDFVFKKAGVVVFVDGDFWHGWRFPTWEHKLTPFWKEKISATRIRDKKNINKLRRSGWIVVRIWEHQIQKDINSCIHRIVKELDMKKQGNQRTER